MTRTEGTYQVLIADDEELEREALGYFIRNSGLEIDVIIECSSGEEALKQIMLHRPEIILLDINMPGLNGLEVLEQVRKLDYRKRVIFSTAYNYFEYAVQALRLEAMDFLVKPVQKEQVISVITHAVDELDEEAAKEYDSTLIKKTLEMMGSKIVNDLVTGEMFEEDLYYLEIMGISCETEGNTFCVYFTAEVAPSQQKEIREQVKQAFDYLDLSVIISWRNSMMTIVVFAPGKCGSDIRQIKMEKMIGSVLKKMGLKFVLGMGEEFEDLSQIEQSYCKAREQVGDLVTKSGDSGQDRNMPGDIEKVCQLIDENYNQKLTLGEIAASVGYSKYYINRLFKQYKGTTVIDYLTHVRIQKAKKLLRSSNYSVKKISVMVGYSEPNYFTLCFKKMEKMSPLQYRYNKGNLADSVEIISDRKYSRGNF